VVLTAQTVNSTDTGPSAPIVRCSARSTHNNVVGRALAVPTTGNSSLLLRRLHSDQAARRFGSADTKAQPTTHCDRWQAPSLSVPLSAKPRPRRTATVEGGDEALVVSWACYRTSPIPIWRATWCSACAETAASFRPQLLHQPVTDQPDSVSARTPTTATATVMQPETTR